MSTPESVTVASSSTLSAEELYLRLLKLYRVGNRLRREFAEVLRELADSRLFQALGFSDISQYAERYFYLKRSQTYEWLRAARKLPELPRLRDALDQGEISWSVLLELSKVATVGTEAEWLEFSRERSVRQVRGEVREAQRKGRDKPRDQPNGLPEIEFRITFDLSGEEHELVRRGLRKIALEMSERTGGGEVPLKDPLVGMARTCLETDPEGIPRGRVERERPFTTVVYRQCTDCRHSVILTPEGPVEVPPEAVDRIADVSEEVTITPEDEMPVVTNPEDTGPRRLRGCAMRALGSNGHGIGSRGGSSSFGSPWVREPVPWHTDCAKKVKLRDGGMCQNPRCGKKLDTQAHHIRFVSEDGEDGLHNQVTVCRPCHTLIHQGLLTVEGNPFDGLRWKPRADLLSPKLEDDLALLARPGLGGAELPPRAERSASESGRPDSPRSKETPESGRPDKEAREELGALTGGLERLGYSRREATSRLEKARAFLLGELEREPTEEELLHAALSARPSGFPGPRNGAP